MSPGSSHQACANSSACNSGDLNYCHSPRGTIAYGLGVTNTITVIALGSTIYFYTNGSFIDQAEAPATGSIGVFATGPCVETEIAFSHLKMWSI